MFLFFSVYDVLRSSNVLRENLHFYIYELDFCHTFKRNFHILNEFENDVAHFGEIFLISSKV